MSFAITETTFINKNAGTKDIYYNVFHTNSCLSFGHIKFPKSELRNFIRKMTSNIGFYFKMDTKENMQFQVVFLENGEYIYENIQCAHVTSSIIRPDETTREIVKRWMQD